MCEQLELPDPQIGRTPELHVIQAEAEGYLVHLIDRWRSPLAEIEVERFSRPEYPSAWGTKYCIDAMLEHAVVHPILHRVQLQELLEEQSSGSFDPARNKLHIRTGDVERFTIDVSRIPINWQRLVVISIDGINSELRRRDHPVLRFARDSHGRWVVIDP